MATLQVRMIDDDLYAVLGKRAKHDNRSISGEVVAILKEYISQPSARISKATEALLALAGSWQDGRSAKKIIQGLRKSRVNRTRLKKGF